jgi:glutamyl/glutaminyl-tRNA synthetase
MVLTDTGSIAVSQKFVIQFRPSSRSSNYSIVAIYKTAKEANKTFKAIKRLLKEIEADKSNKYDVDWSEEDVEVWVEGNKVQFNVDTSGYTDPIENVMRTMTPESISLFEDMQTRHFSHLASRGNGWSCCSSDRSGRCKSHRFFKL